MAAEPVRMSVEEYLTFERAAEERHEYWNGEVFAMAGGRQNHDDICNNLSRYVQNRLDGKPCRVQSSNMKVGITKARGFAYPDLTIVCGERQYFDKTRDVLTNPTVIFEVLSESTKGFDAVRKFANYQKLDSLRHYVLVDQDQRLVVHHHLNSVGQWMTEILTEESAVLKSKLRRG